MTAKASMTTTGAMEHEFDYDVCSNNDGIN